MKFINEIDEVYYNAELKQSGLDEAGFIKRRSGLVKSLKNSRFKDFRKSQDTKQQWRKDRTMIMKGIKKFHKSTKGKRFHRQLGRFLATRDLRVREGFENRELFLPVSGVLTHVLLEHDYYLPLMEQVEYELFADTVYNIVVEIFKSLLDEKGDLSFYEEFLFAMVETTALIKAFADRSGKSEEEVDKLWNKSKDIVKKQYNKDEKDVDFFKLVTGVLKKILSLT